MNTDDPKHEQVEILSKILNTLVVGNVAQGIELLREVIEVLNPGDKSLPAGSFPSRDFEIAFRTACRKHNVPSAAYIVLASDKGDKYRIHTGGHTKAAMLLGGFLKEIVTSRSRPPAALAALANTNSTPKENVQ